MNNKSIIFNSLTSCFISVSFLELKSNSWPNLGQTEGQAGVRRRSGGRRGGNWRRSR